MNRTSMDLDPLSYEYTAYNNYPVNTSQQYPYNVKVEESLYYNQGHNNYQNALYTNNDYSQPSTTQQEKTGEEPKQETIKEEHKNPVKKKQKKAYCSKKINDTSFPFYGCSVCNVSYLSLNELDQHVTIHKDRMTSYRLRLRNQFKKKQMKKEKKRLKKLKKIKQEPGIEIEIKPEDGYIGNDRAADYNMYNDTGAIDFDAALDVGNNSNSTIMNTADGNAVRNMIDEMETANNSINNINSTVDANSTAKNVLDDNAMTNDNSISNVNATLKTGTDDNILTNTIENNMDSSIMDSTNSNGTIKKNIDRKKAKNVGDNSENNVTNEKTNVLNNVNESVINNTTDGNSRIENLNSTNIMNNTKGIDNNKKNVEINSSNTIRNNTADASSNGENRTPSETDMSNMEKIYKCFACQKQFTLSYYLKLHVRSHTDEKPYSCNVCGQSFITASKLGRHNKRIHLAARFQCRICFKIFSRFELLTTHFDKHHPEDKLDGEPYDYNAILPYLKELEEQLKEQSEMKEQKPDTIFDDVVNIFPADIKEEEQSQDGFSTTKIEVVLEEMNPPVEVDVQIKVEEDAKSDGPGDQVAEAETAGDSIKQDDDDAFKNDDFKDDSFSDEDYFPANTWAATPKCDPGPPETPTPKPKKTYKVAKCEICQKEMSSTSYMRVHMRTHTGEKPFKCCTCGRGFITSSKLNRHILTHGDAVVKPEKVTVKKENEINGELPDGSKPVKKKKKRSKKKKEVTEDGIKRQQRRPHACEYCNQRFLHLNMLEVHKKSHKGEPLVLKCHFCLEEMSDINLLREHETTHLGPKPYLCTLCGRNYMKRETMIYHRKHHTNEQEFICDVCSKSFNEQGKLAKHLRTHTGEKFVLRYECPVCAHMFNTKYHVEMHLTTHQKEGLILESNRNEILAMVLQNALKIPKQPDATANLTDTTPSDERFCICKICGETFHHFYYLEEHLKSHGSKIAIDSTNEKEEKKYICEVCNKAFKLHYYLKLHSFTHSKEKPFICQQCGKGFITKGKLKRHLETHTGLKKYQCHICYKFFTRPSYLRIHIRTIHGTQDYNYRYDKSCMSLSAMSALTQLSDSQNSI